MCFETNCLFISPLFAVLLTVCGEGELLERLIVIYFLWFTVSSPTSPLKKCLDKEWTGCKGRINTQEELE